MDGLPWELIVWIGGALLAVAAVVAWVARKPLLALTPASPEAVLRDLAFRLRASGRSAREEAGRLVVRIDSLAVAKLHARPGPRGTEVRYEVDATGLGWTLILVLAGIGYVGAVGFAVALLIHLRVREFARGEVAPLLASAPLGAPPPKDARALLLEGLSEAQRLVSEALEYEREARENAVGLVLLGSLALWVALFLVFLFLAPLAGVYAPLAALAIASAATAAVAGFAVPRVRARGTARLEELVREEALFRGALMAEASGFPVPGAPRAGLELLLHAAERSGAWREIRRRRKLVHDPMAGFTIFLFAWGAGISIALGTGLDILPLALRIGLVLFGVGCAAGFAWSVRSWRRQVREEDERDRRAWEELRERIEGELLGKPSG